MRKLYLTLGIILMLGLVTATIVGVSWEKDLNLTDEKITKIKGVANLPEINIEVGEIICDDEDCWATIYQKDLIQETFRMEKDYCSKYEENEFNETECTKYTDYTLDEIKTKIQEYTEKRIGEWADVEDVRQKKVKTKMEDKGKIKEKDK